jgi:uncharacterized protein YbaA (DUF1428 family)
VIVFAWVTYPSKSARDRIMKKVMSDPRLEGMAEAKDMPFDGMRMFWGGFKPFLKT